MNNLKAIQPINVWINGTINEAQTITLDNYTGYDFKGNPGMVSWTLNAYTYTTDDNQQAVVGIRPLISGTVELTTAVVDSWGSSDQIIFDHVASVLNITLI